MTNRTRSIVTAAALLLLVGPAAGAGAATPSARGVVDVWTNVPYQGGEWCASGIVLSGSGEVLTTNDVVRGATSIRVSDPDNGRTYAATVSGYDAGADVAVLQLEHASALPTARLGNSALAQAGEHVTAYGNPGTRGLPPAAVSGRVLIRDQDFVEENLDGSEGLLLPALIANDAPAPPSFTGGPLVGSSGKVIGLTTLGRVEQGVQLSALEGAVPIDRARAIAATIAAGKTTEQIHVGPTAVLGIAVEPGDLYEGLTTGVTVLAVLTGALRHAGVEPGDIIQSLAGHLVSSPNDLMTRLNGKKPGDRVQLVWVGPAGGVHSARIRLTAGPPQ